MSAPGFFSSDSRRTEFAWTDWEAVTAFMAAQRVCRLAVNDGPWPYVIALGYDFYVDTFIVYFSRRGKLARALLADAHCTVEIDEAVRIDRAADGSISAEYRSVVARCRAELREVKLPPLADRESPRSIYSCRAHIVHLSAKKRIRAEVVAP